MDATTPSNIETLNASLLSHQDDHELEQHAKVDKKELTDVTDTASIVSSPGKSANKILKIREIELFLYFTIFFCLCL